jgi:hypothetical protein
MNALRTTCVARSRRKLRNSRGENWVDESWSATTVRPRTSAITVTTVLVIEIRSTRASSAVPWNASQLNRESGGTSIWEMPRPTTSAISAAALGSTQSAPPTYSSGLATARTAGCFVRNAGLRSSAWCESGYRQQTG